MFFRFCGALLFSSLIPSSSGFVQEFIAKAQQTPFLPKTELDDNTNALVTGVPLDISLQIGSEKEGSIFSIQRLVVNLQSQHMDADLAKTVAPMPDHTAFCAHVTQSGQYIDRRGLQTLDINNDSPCWQLIWRASNPAGNCVIGLDVQSAAQRNEAGLEAGALFVSFPVWKQERLVEFQSHKAECELAAAVHLQERDAEIVKMKQATNIIAKAWHYRNAAAAVEKYHMQPVRSMAAIPNDDDVIEISDSLKLARLGTVWKKEDKGFGLHTNIYMGTASLKIPQVQPQAPKTSHNLAP